MTPSEELKFEWTLDEDDDRSEAERLRLGLGDNTNIQEEVGMLPVLIPIVIYGVVIGVGLSEQVWDWWEARKKKGLLIHVSKDGKLELKPIGIPYGQVIFIGADGKTFMYVNVTKNMLGSLIQAASGGLAPSGGSPLTSTGRAT
jgi:hypothetical protein